MNLFGIVEEFVVSRKISNFAAILDVVENNCKMANKTMANSQI
jgi:hypothetical protein